MKRTIVWLAMFVVAGLSSLVPSPREIAHAQQQVIICQAPNVPCSITGPMSTATGDPPWLFNGRSNFNFTQLYGMFGPTSNLHNNGVATFSDIVGLWEGCGPSLPLLTYGGNCVSAAGTGTVTSVGLTAPSIFTVSGSPVTTSGTLEFSLNSQTANTFLAAPSGSSGTPNFRAILSADLPPINLSSTQPGGVTGTLLQANGGTGAASLAGAQIPIFTGNISAYDCAQWASSTSLQDFGKPCGNGTVTSVSVINANGLSGSVANPTSTPAITLAPTFTGIAYSDGGGFVPAVGSNFPTLNQSTTGQAGTALALAATPTPCPSGQAAQGILANGNATGCFTPASGAVTSVGLTAPSIFTVSGSPVTGAGTLALSYSGTPLPVANGGTGTASPSLVPGTNITITGTWPNQTINSSGGGGGSPAGSQYQLQINGGSGSFGAISNVSGGLLIGQASGAPTFDTLIGDCAITTSGDITCTKTSGVSFGALATIAPGTGVATALTDDVGSAGAIVVNGGALGTPSSGNASNFIDLPLTTGVAGVLGSANGGTGAASLAGAFIPTWTGSITAGHCVEWATATTQEDAGANCGSGGSGIDQLTGDVTAGPGTGSQAATVVQIEGAAIPTTAAVVATNSSKQLIAATTTGSGATVVLGTSPTLVTPTLGAALATSINGNTFTTGSYTLTGSAGKTLDFTNSLTLAGTDGTTMTFPATSQTIAGLGTAQTFTAAQTFTNSDIRLLGSSTGYNTFTAANSSSTDYTTTVPANTGTLAELNLAQTWSAVQTFPNSDIIILGSSTGGTALASANASTTNYTATLPAATDTIVELTQTQMLTNKTLTAPTMTAPVLGTPASGTMTNVTGLPISTGVSGLGTGVASALADNVGSAGAPVVNGGALGTPSSGVATNLTGTASGLNIGGTAANLSGTPALPNGTTATTQTSGDDTTKLATDAFVLANASSSGVSSAAAGSGITVTGTGSGPYTGAITISASYVIRAVSSGSTDTILDTDCANGVNYTSSSAVAITLPQATSSFAACSVDVINNSAETETVTPTTSTINGASSLAVPAGTSVNITALSGNYIAAGTGVGGLTHTIASGTATLGTSAIASGACASAVTVSATGVLTTDTISVGFNGDPTSTVGYEPSTSGTLTIIPYPTSGDVNIKVCNLTASSITPGAVTLNWAVHR